MWRVLAGAVSMLAVLAAAYGFGRASGWDARDRTAKADELAWALKTTRLAQASHVITVTAGADASASRARIVLRTRTIHDEVPVYVTPEDDGHCDVPVGFVRLHDAAAAGVLPAPPAGADAGPSGVALSSVAGTVSDNYGACLAAFDQLTRLQAWVRAQQDLYGGVR